MLLTILSWAVINLSSAFMRTSPDYEAPLDNQLMMGELVQTLETSRYWVKVVADDYTGWIVSDALAVLTDEEKEAYLEAPKWICMAEYSRVRTSPSESAAPLTDISMGDLVRQAGKSSGGWTQILLPDGRCGWVLSHELMDFGQWAQSRAATNRVREITDLACSFAGTPYMWGGNTVKYFDCSGLAQFCYFMNGILLPRNASQQQRCGTPVTDGAYMPGDLLFFGSKKPLKITHVAIYIGQGRIVHSSQKVKIMSLEEYGREVVAATRILCDTGIGKGALSILDSPYYFRQDGDKQD